MRKGPGRPRKRGRKTDSEREKRFEQLVECYKDSAHLKLNLGCGNTLLDGFINIDKIERERILTLNLEHARFPFADESVVEIAADQLLEHIINLIPLMNECWRVLKKGGRFNISVPCYPFVEAFQDPTHVRFFTIRTFHYWYKGDFLYENVGKTYGIKPFTHFIQSIVGWNLKATLIK